MCKTCKMPTTMNVKSKVLERFNESNLMTNINVI